MKSATPLLVVFLIAFGIIHSVINTATPEASPEIPTSFRLEDSDRQALLSTEATQYSANSGKEFRDELDALLDKHPDLLRFNSLTTAYNGLVEEGLNETQRKMRSEEIEFLASDAAADEFRSKSLQHWLTFAHGAERIEQRDVLFRLNSLFKADIEQAEKEIARAEWINSRVSGGVSKEEVDLRKDFLLSLKANAETLVLEADALELLYPAKEGTKKLLNSLATYFAQRNLAAKTQEKLLHARSDLDFCARVFRQYYVLKPLHAYVQGHNPDSGAPLTATQVNRETQRCCAAFIVKFAEASGQSRKRCLSEMTTPNQNYLLSLESAVLDAMIGVIRSEVQADSAAIQVEVEYLRSSLDYHHFTLAATDAYLEKLDNNSKVLALRRKILSDRYARREALERVGAVSIQESERVKRELDHFEHADARSQSDRATLLLFRKYVEKLVEADTLSLAAATKASELLTRRSSTVTSLQKRVQDLAIQRGNANGDSTNSLARLKFHRGVIAAGIPLHISEQPLNAVAAFEDLRKLFSSPLTQDSQRIVPFASLPRNIFHDPSAIQWRGPEKLPWSVLINRAAPLDAARAPITERSRGDADK